MKNIKNYPQALHQKPTKNLKKLNIYEFVTGKVSFNIY